MRRHDEVLEILKMTDTKSIFKIKDLQTNKIYIESVLPAGDEALYRQLQTLTQTTDIAIPKIVDLYVDEQLYVIQEYMRYHTLAEYIEHCELTREDIYDIMLQLCDILDILHHAHPPIIHRDIKPENIFYSGHKVYLTDFDIARNYSSDKDKDTTVLGSIGYAAPEQYGFGQTNTQADIYAMGVLFHVLLSGYFPYEHLYEGKEKAIITKAISISPEQRYRDIRHFKNDILSLDQLRPIKRYQRPINYYFPVGLRTFSPIINCLFLMIYIVFALIIVSMTFEDVSSWQAMNIRVASALWLYGTVFFWGNYANVFDICLWKNAENKAVVYAGRIISYLLIYLCLLMFFTLIY